MTSVWCDANKFEPTEVSRHDEVICQFWGFERMAGHASFQHFFNKLDLAANQKVFAPLYQWFFKNLRFHNLTLDKPNQGAHYDFGSDNFWYWSRRFTSK